MADQLTDRQRERLHRWFDGELDEAEASEIEQLLERSDAAREYVARLEEIRNATSLADSTVSKKADTLLDTDQLVASAVESPPVEDEPLESLSPLLERYHDGEILPAEERLVAELRDCRNDVDEYLAVLEELGYATRAADRQLRSGVDFDDLRDEVAHRLDDPTDHRSPELIHRYVDGELSSDGRERVEQWLESDPDAKVAVSTLEAVGEATRMAMEEARSSVDLGDLWNGVQRRVATSSAESAGTSEDVVSLESARDSSAAQPETDGGTVLELFSAYSSHLTGAAAAAVLLLAAAALLRPGFFLSGADQPQKKTVVIVDSVEYGSNSSVVVDSPMKKVKGEVAAKPSRDSEDRESTVIWLLDSKADGDAPSSKSDDGAASSDDDSDTTRTDAPARDAGAPDASDDPSGQPI